MSHAEREHKAHAPTSVSFAIVTVSDSRDLESDASGKTVAALATDHGHKVVARSIVKDEPSEIKGALREALSQDADIILFTGGTGIAPRDVTIESIAPRFTKRLPGFGELFRTLSFETLGSAAMATRADAGVIAGKLVFLLPGSPDACRVAMEKLILPEAGHLVGLLRRGASRP